MDIQGVRMIGVIFEAEFLLRIIEREGKWVCALVTDLSEELKLMEFPEF